MHSKAFRMNRRCLAALLVALSAASSQVRAEDLVQVFDAARNHDAALRAAQRQRDAAQPRAAQAKALFLPSINVQGGSTRSRIDPPAGEEVPEGTRLYGTTTSANLVLRQALYNRQHAADLRHAGLEEQLAQTDYELTLQDFIVRAAQAYFDVLSAQDVLAATRRSKESILGQLNAAQVQYKAGTGIITDVRDAQARYDLAAALEQASENELRISAMVLARLTGRPGLQPAPLAQPATQAAALPPLVPDSVEAWSGELADHPVVRRARLTLDAARASTERARAGRLPTLELVSSLGYSRQSGSVPTAQGLQGTTRQASIGVELNLPLFAGHSIDNRIRETLILEGKAEDELEAARQSVAQATERAFFQLQSARAQLSALQTASVSSQQSLEATQRGYKAGVRLSLDVLNAQAMLFETQRDLARSRYAVLMGQLKLRQAAGRLTVDDLQEVNRSVAQ